MFIQAFARCSIFMAGNREFPLGFSGVGISEKKRGNIRDLRRHLAVLRSVENCCPWEPRSGGESTPPLLKCKKKLFNFDSTCPSYPHNKSFSHFPGPFHTAITNDPLFLSSYSKYACSPEMEKSVILKNWSRDRNKPIKTHRITGFKWAPWNFF